MPAIGWAAGIDRLVLLLENIAKPPQAHEKPPYLSITTMITKEELKQEAGPRIRKSAFRLKQLLQLKLAASGVEIKIDLREGIKLNERIGSLMSGEGSQGVIVIGFEESERIELMQDLDHFQVSIKKQGQITKCLVKDIKKFI